MSSITKTTLLQSSPPTHCQELNQEQAENKLQSFPLGSWMMRLSQEKTETTLSVKLSETYIVHYLVKKEGHLWYQMDEETNTPFSKGFLFEALLKECDARPNLQITVPTSPERVTKTLPQPHFHHISKQQAKELLQGQPPGTYLFRPADGNSENLLTVSFVDKKGALVHQNFQLGINAYKSTSHYIETHESILIRPYQKNSTFRLVLPNKTNKMLCDEYSNFPQNQQPDRCSIACEVQNMPKNRFVNALPFNENVFADGDFYYNASKLFEGRAIAAQGPEELHSDDFWQMVWKSDSRTVVMLTKTDECCKYWPNLNEEKKYGDISIKSESEEIKDSLTIRRLILNGERTLTHFQFSGFPDHGTAAPKALASLVKCLAGSFTQTRPITVHCRAGIGRTGTLLAALFTYHKIKEDGSKGPDPQVYYQTALEIRKGRMGSIQNEEQYICGYRTLEELFGD